MHPMRRTGPSRAVRVRDRRNSPVRFNSPTHNAPHFTVSPHLIGPLSPLTLLFIDRTRPLIGDVSNVAAICRNQTLHQAKRRTAEL